MKKVYPIKEVCIGCHICELACAVAHSESGDLIVAWKEERAKGLSPCKTVLQQGAVTVAISCRHCDDPACVATCISGALHKDAEGRTAYDESKCVGCWSCLMACPYGAIKRHPVKEKIVKCDLCVGRDKPACVEACPNLALVLREEE